MIGLYVAGDSLLHRVRPGPKLLALLLLTSVVILLPRPLVVTVSAVLVAGVALAAGLGLRGLARLVRPLFWLVLVLTPLQAWLAGWERAYVVVGGLVVAMTAAGIVSATTRVADMTDALTSGLERLRPVGVDPDRVALVLALTIRAIPVVIDALRVVREARRARGMRLTPDTLLAPLLTRTIRHADRVGEALAARGVDD